MRRAEREEMYKSLKKIVKVHVIININMYNKNYNIINRYIIDLRVGWGLIARPQLCLLSPVSILYQEVSAVSSPPSGTEAYSFIFSSLFSYVSPQQGQLFTHIKWYYQVPVAVTDEEFSRVADSGQYICLMKFWLLVRAMFGSPTFNWHFFYLCIFVQMFH